MNSYFRCISIHFDLSFWKFFSSAGVGLEAVSRDAHHLAEALLPGGGPEERWELPCAPVLSGHLHTDDTGNGHALTRWLNGSLMCEIKRWFAFIIADYYYRSHNKLVLCLHFSWTGILARPVSIYKATDFCCFIWSLIYNNWIMPMLSERLPKTFDDTDYIAWICTPLWLGSAAILKIFNQCNRTNNVSLTKTYPTC